jgi:protein-tyrosine phosphatase
MIVDRLRATRNQLFNVGHKDQGEYRKVLFLCHAGLLRSATAAHIFSAPPYNWNTRTAGVAVQYALNPVTEALLEWADLVVCVEPDVRNQLAYLFVDHEQDDDFLAYAKKIVTLNIPDDFQYMEVDLITMLTMQMHKYWERSNDQLR